MPQDCQPALFQTWQSLHCMTQLLKTNLFIDDRKTDRWEKREKELCIYIEIQIQIYI